MSTKPKRASANKLAPNKPTSDASPSATQREHTGQRPRNSSRRQAKRIRALRSARRACEVRAESLLPPSCLQQMEVWLEDNYFKLVRFASARGSKEPEDAVQDAWRRAQRSYCPDWAFPPLFFRVLRCVVADQFRAYYRKPPGEPLEDHLATLVTEENDRQDEGLAEVLGSVLNQLPQEWTQLLWACYGGELRQEEVANRLGISVGALKMRLLRVRSLAQAILYTMGCKSFTDVAAFDLAALKRPKMVACPRPARSQPRPSCRAPHGKGA